MKHALSRPGRAARNACLLLVLTVAAFMIPAQEPDLTPWVLVIPAANNTGDAALDAVGATVAQTIDVSLRLLGEFDVRSMDADGIPPAVIAGDPEALAAFSRAETMDYIVFGAVETSADDNIVIEAAVWDRGAGAITVEERRTAFSLFDTFDVADELAGSFLSAFSGQRIAFGAIRLARDGWPDGTYRVLVDGTEVARDTSLVSNVLIGERTIEVIATNGPAAGEVLLAETVTVAEGATASLAFTVPEPPPDEGTVAETAEPGEPVEEETPAEEAPAQATAPTEEEPTAEAPAQAEPVEDETDDAVPPIDPVPWSRITRADPDRRPIFSFGIDSSTFVDVRDGRRYVPPPGGLSSFWIGADTPGRFYFQLGLDLAEYESMSTGTELPSETQAHINDGGDIDAVGETRIAVRAAAGYRVLERDLGPFRADLVPTVRASLSFWDMALYADDSWTALQTADGVQFGVVPHSSVGLGILGRIHFWRLSFRARGFADLTFPLGGDQFAAGNDLFFSSTGPAETSIRLGSGASVSLGVALGASFSVGGRMDRGEDGTASGEESAPPRWSRIERRQPGRFPVFSLSLRYTGGTMTPEVSGNGFEALVDADIGRRWYAAFSIAQVFSDVLLSDDRQLGAESADLTDATFWSGVTAVEAAPQEQFHSILSLGYVLADWRFGRSTVDLVGLGRLGFAATSTAFVVTTDQERVVVLREAVADFLQYDRFVTGVGVLGRFHRRRFSLHAGIHLDRATLTDDSYSLQGEELVVLPGTGDQYPTGVTIDSDDVDQGIFILRGYIGIGVSFGGNEWPFGG